MKNTPIFSILISTLILFYSCNKKAEEELPANNFKTQHIAILTKNEGCHIIAFQSAMLVRKPLWQLD